jgi:hypothetical protein
MKPVNTLGVPYKGKVVDNADPKRLGRVKVLVEGLLEDPTPANLPWVYQKSPSGMGGRTDLSSFSAPEIGSELIVEFPYGDIYAGFYSGYWQSEETHQGYLDEDYPHSYGFRDIQNTFLKINKAKKILEFQHASGARMYIDSDSAIELMSDKKISFVSKDGKTEFAFNMDTGSLSLNPKQSLDVGGNLLNLKSKEIVVDTGNLTETIAGGQDTQVVGGRKSVIGGGDSRSVLADSAESVGGDESRLVAGKQSEVIGMGTEVTIVTVGEKKTIMLGNSELDMILGNYKVNTLAGALELSNLLGKVVVSATGGIEASNLMGKVSISATGAVEVSNNLGSMKIDATGGITMDAAMAMKFASMMTAEFSGLMQTKIGSMSGMTEIDGMLVSVGGPGGSPAAYLGGMCIGIGNLGAPVICTIALGSTSVLVKP